MKKFLKIITLFSLSIMFFFGINLTINYIIISKTNPVLKKSRVIIIGDSHPQKALNPSLMDDAQNIAQGDEPYILSYWKLKKIFNIIKPDTVIISFSPHNISAQNDLKFAKKKWASEMFKRSFTILNFNDLKNIETSYAIYLKTLFKQIGFYPKKKHFHYIGDYSNSNFTDVSNANRTAKRHYYFENELLGISETSISYLDSIIKECKNNKVIPILISSPVHRNYSRLIPPHIMKRFIEVKNKFQSKEVIIIDKTLEFYPDSLYFDSDHLNKKGARKFTSEIKKIIKVNR